MNIDFLKVKNGSESEFEAIARELMNKYAIQNNDSIYRITEVEFYWNSPEHKDDSTYKRTYVEPKNGDWFFHYSGVDIALKDEENGGYGGILIREIYNLKEQKFYKGPLVCTMKLFSGTSVFSESIKTKIIEYNQFEEKEIKKRPRVGLGNNAKESDTDKLEYNFYVEHW